MVGSASIDADDGEVDVELAWEKLPPLERQARLQVEFAEFVARVESGERSPVLVAEAEGVLSELRAQMYVTPRGREEHEALEEQWNELIEEQESNGDGAESN